MKSWFFYGFVTVAGLALFVVSSKYFNRSAAGIPATATARELVIRSGDQAEVIRVLVQSGQAVRRGDTLLVMSSLDLSGDEEGLSTRIASLETERRARLTGLNNSIQLARNQNSLEVIKLREEINQAERELELNIRLSGRKDLSGSETPSAIRIRDLKAREELLQQQLVQKENELRASHATNNAILQNQIELSQLELQAVKIRRKDLIKIADNNAVVGSVPVRPGSAVDAFATVVTLIPANPTIATAYLPTGQSGFEIGSEVQVETFGDPQSGVTGKVIGYGSMVPLPEILQKSTAVRAFGKEVFIGIPEQNAFTTGEKLLVKPSLQ